MGRGKSTQPAQSAEPEATDPEVADQTGGDPMTVENENLGGAGDLADSGVSETEDLPELSKEESQAAIASSVGGTDQYPYVDRTAVPMHERTLPMSSTDEASSAELNPAFYPKPEDGGPVKENPDGEDVGIGTEPNRHEQLADMAENAGGDREETLEALDGTDQQMDVDAVNAAAEERAPEDVDASTGQQE